MSVVQRYAVTCCTEGHLADSLKFQCSSCDSEHRRVCLKKCPRALKKGGMGEEQRGGGAEGGKRDEQICFSMFFFQVVLES